MSASYGIIRLSTYPMVNAQQKVAVVGIDCEEQFSNSEGSAMGIPGRLHGGGDI